MQIIAKLKFKSDILKSSNKSISYYFFYNFFYINFIFVYIKIPKNLSSKYYQKNKGRLQKSF